MRMIQGRAHGLETYRGRGRSALAVSVHDFRILVDNEINE